MHELLQDIQFAVRAMRRRPAPSVLAILTFALGIAASTAMFSVVDAVLLRPLPFADPGRIVSVYAHNPQWSDHPTMHQFADRGWFSYPEYRVLREQSTGLLDGLAILSTGGTLIEQGGEPERIPIGQTTPELFGSVLRVVPIHGRLFEPEDERSGENVVLLTEGLWRRRFGADPAIVGTDLRFGETPFRVIGILPLEAALSGFEVDAWVVYGGDENWGNHWLTAIGRLAEGSSIEQVEARLATVLPAAAPAGHDAHAINLFVRQADETRSARGPLLLLSVASLLLLAVACGNVAALLVGTAIDREGELAVRAALGAGRGRLVRQLLTESVVLAAAAAVLGVLLAVVATRALVLLAPPDVPRIGNAAISLRVLAFGITLSLAFGALFGLIPALGFSRTDLRRSMTVTTRGTTAHRGRVQGAVVVAELALATLLLVGAGLLTRTVLALNAQDPGFAARETLGLRLSIPFTRMLRDVEGDTARFAAVDAFWTRLMDELARTPGVSGVAMTSVMPLTPDRNNNDVSPEGLAEPVIAERRFVSPDYFDVLGIRIIEGRAFEPGEDRPDAGTNTVIVSEGLARLAWPGESALGKRLRWWDRDATVVGVAAELRDEELVSETTLAFYAPRRQAGQLGGSLILRTQGDPSAVVTAIRARIREVNPGIAIISARPLSELIADDIAAQRYRARLIMVFALLAALFALLGIYGVTARDVAARTRELGIRMALGARRTGIVRLVLARSLRLAAYGAAAGIVVSLIATRSIESYLYGVPRTDPLTMIAIALLLGAASVLAAAAPGRRAARLDPLVALRTE